MSKVVDAADTQVLGDLAPVCDDFTTRWDSEMRLDPATAIGEWALVSLIGFAAGIGMVIAAVAAGERAGETFTSNWWLAGPEIVAAVCAVATVLFGVLAIRIGDRAVAVVGATCFGLFVTLWVSMAIAFPR